MRLLILTQAVDLDDPILAFFHRWIEEFAKHADIHVICLQRGRTQLPANVNIHSLGKEADGTKLGYVLRFYKYIWTLRKEYDAVFVHMNPEYVVLGGMFWKLWRKRIGLWYVHRAYPALLRLAVPFVDAVFTSATTSTALRGPKVHVVGHGIDTAAYAHLKPISRNSDRLKLLTVGRITRIKNIEVIIQALAHLQQNGIRASLRIVGSPIHKADFAYKEELERIVSKHSVSADVTFEGSIPHAEMPQVYAEADISINACPTGGIDKAVLESMASGVPAIAANESFKEFFGDYSEQLLFPYRDAPALAGRIQKISQNPAPHMSEKLKELAREKADVRTVVSAIIAFYDSDR